VLERGHDIASGDVPNHGDAPVFFSFYRPAVSIRKWQIVVQIKAAGLLNPQA